MAEIPPQHQRPVAQHSVANALGHGPAGVIAAYVAARNLVSGGGARLWFEPVLAETTPDEGRVANEPSSAEAGSATLREQMSMPVTTGGVCHGWLSSLRSEAESLPQLHDELLAFLGVDHDLRLLRELAYTDELTGAGNRREFDRFVPQAIAAATENGRALPLMLLDVDNFKQYNDRFGHAAGDEVLRETVTLVKATIRRGDRVFRIGGDEFVVVFSDPNAPRAAGSPPIESVAQVAARFQQRIRQLHLPALGIDAVGSITISAGLATYPIDGQSPAALLAAADHRALESKRRGKDLITFGPTSPETA